MTSGFHLRALKSQRSALLSWHSPKPSRAGLAPERVGKAPGSTWVLMRMIQEVSVFCCQDRCQAQACLWRAGQRMPRFWFF